MKIAVITLPLHTNYGGLLQAYALKSCLEKGHEVTVIDREEKMPLPVWYKAPFIYVKRFIARSLGHKDVEVFRERTFRREYPVLTSETGRFTDVYIAPRTVKSYKDIKEGEYDLFIVGSDQVWRPWYFGRIEDAFLAFARGWDVKRGSYAASFGTDALEYDSEQLARCSELLAEFDAVSVRERSAVEMCGEWFDRHDAELVLDPVLLMDSSELLNIAGSVPRGNGGMVTYVLDPDGEKSALTERMASAAGVQVENLYVDVRDRSIPLERRIVPSVEKWIAGFRDASFVVTDSYHGCILSILLHKPFIALGNPLRGMSRIYSLLEMLGLDDRLVQGIDPEDDCSYWLAAPDWNEVDKRLDAARMMSFKFMEKILK